jgi:hypothetical protein
MKLRVSLPQRRVVALSVVGVVTLAISIALLVRWAPDWLASTRGLSPSDRAADVGRVRTALLGILAGGIAIVGAIYTARTYALNRQAQITERFTRAIDQLGSDQVSVRLGSIYALERIARESPVDHGPIMEILAGFLREHGKRDDQLPGEIPTDVQAVLSVIARRDTTHDGRSFNFFGCDFRRADFEEAQLIGASFRGANMTNALARGINVVAGTFPGATLVSVRLIDARLSDSWWLDANLEKAELSGANLERAELENANLSDADLTGANLRGTILQTAVLNDTRLDDAVYDDATTWPPGFDPDGRGAHRT